MRCLSSFLMLSVILASALSLAAQSTTNAIPRVSITDLLAHRNDYRGKRVEVFGYYRSDFETSELCELTGYRDMKSLWIEPFAKPGHKKSVLFINRGMVRVVGTFDYNVRQPELGVGHLNMWRAQLVALEVFEEIK